MAKHIAPTSLKVEQAKMKACLGTHVQTTQASKFKKPNKVYVCSGGANAQNRARGGGGWRSLHDGLSCDAEGVGLSSHMTLLLRACAPKGSTQAARRYACARACSKDNND